MEKIPLGRRGTFSRNGSLFYRTYIKPLLSIVLILLFLVLGIASLIIAYALEDQSDGYELFIAFAIIFFVFMMIVIRKSS
jgi:hypothetical protein